MTRVKFCMEVTEKVEKGRDMFPEFHLPHPILHNAIDAMESCVDAIQSNHTGKGPVVQPSN